jgi:aminodeoxyfutalosine deaminase
VIDRGPRWIRDLPKAELHVHLEGSVTAELAERLALRNGVAEPPRPPADGFADFDGFIRCFLAISRCFVTAEDFAEATADLARRHAAQGVVWAEITFTPVTHQRRGVAPEVIAEGLVEGRRRAWAEHGVGIGWVFDVVRGFDDQAAPTLDFMRRVARADAGSVVAIGLGGPEAAAPAVDGVEAVFAQARAEGFGRVPHAGELSGPSSIWDAVRRLGAQRIGHGVRCLEDDALVQHLVAEGIVLEVCPTSNVRLGVAADLATHPLPRLLAAGVAVTLGSDDPTLFGRDLLGEYLACREAYGWSDATVVDLAAASIRHSFMPAVDKARWLAQISAAAP